MCVCVFVCVCVSVLSLFCDVVLCFHYSYPIILLRTLRLSCFCCLVDVCVLCRYVGVPLVHLKFALRHILVIRFCFIYIIMYLFSIANVTLQADAISAYWLSYLSEVSIS